MTVWKCTPDGTLPDWSKEREEHAKEQVHREEMIESFSNIPEVVAFYEKYDDANVSVRDDHVSYFAVQENGLQSKMNLYYTWDDELTQWDFIVLMKKAYSMKFHKMVSRII